MPTVLTNTLRNVIMRREWIVLLGLILTLTLDKDVYCQNSEHKICFDFDSHVLISQYDSKITVITSQIESNDYSYIKIFGYSSPVGDSAYNMELSKKRAYSVYNKINEIVKIDDKRFYMTWIGESSGDYDLHYENSHSQSRCVDILIQKRN